MSLPFCSIIILNYNGESLLLPTLKSVLKLHYPYNKFEIIIVDNASTDQSRRLIQNITTLTYSGNPILTEIVENKPIIRSVLLSKNIGFAAGNNVGVQEAKGKYVVLLNNDCMVHEDWLKELVLVAEKDERIFSVNPKVYLGETHKIQNAGIRIFSNGYAQDIGASPQNKIQDYELDKGQYEQQKEIDASCAVATLYRKSLFQKVGCFDENYFLYYEDVDISLRAKNNGYMIVYNPKAIAYHLHAVSSQENSPFFIFNSERGRLLFLKNNFSIILFLKEYVVFIVKALGRLLLTTKNKMLLEKNLSYLQVAISLFHAQ